MSRTPLNALERLGLTSLEAQAYAFLVTESPASGYRVAQALGKPFGSVYKAIEGLDTKGAALLSEESGNRVARAVPIEQVVSRAAADFDRSCRTLKSSLRSRPRTAPDEHLYRIRDREQFFLRARASIDESTMFIVGTATPAIAELLADSFAAAAARGVRVGLKTFAPIDIKGVDIVSDHRGPAALETGPGEWIMMTFDGREVLVGLFDPDTGELNTGHWSENPLLAWSMYTGLGASLILAAVRTSPLATDARFVKIIEHLNAYRTPMSIGKRTLMEKFRQPSRGRNRAGRSKR